MAEPPTDAHYSIRLNKEVFTFCAAHFITFNGDTCEPLHGHNYRVGVEVEGPLDDNSYVFDFIALRDAVTGIASRLDHKMLLPTQHAMINVGKSLGPHGGEEVVATFGKRRWVFPADECVLLPIANTTAELLAFWIGSEISAWMGSAGVSPPPVLTVSVDECEGQVGVCRLVGS